MRSNALLPVECRSDIGRERPSITTILRKPFIGKRIRKYLPEEVTWTACSKETNIRLVSSVGVSSRVPSHCVHCSKSVCRFHSVRRKPNSSVFDSRTATFHSIQSTCTRTSQSLRWSGGHQTPRIGQSSCQSVGSVCEYRGLISSTYLRRMAHERKSIDMQRPPVPVVGKENDIGKRRREFTRPKEAREKRTSTEVR